ncbi:MAG: hypothetical protein Q8K36_05745, partial [Alphaproteobacteria bacterium]|nr:hypothetical protein [Alphaproteobacteria bacterium]
SSGEEAQSPGYNGLAALAEALRRTKESVDAISENMKNRLFIVAESAKGSRTLLTLMQNTGDGKTVALCKFKAHRAHQALPKNLKSEELIAIMWALYQIQEEAKAQGQGK